MVDLTCPHCGYGWREAVDEARPATCPHCGGQHHLGKGGQPGRRAEEVEPTVEEAETARPWRMPRFAGGPLSRIVFVVVMLLVFAAIVWVVLPPVLHFWEALLAPIEENARP